MASVMYVTDHGMIEYHRINGDDDLIFWRPLSQTRMKKFYPGDLIFFLTKVDVPGHSNEKGIVGYGRYVYSEKLRLDTMWKKYTTKNGFDTKAELTKVLKELSGLPFEKRTARFRCVVSLIEDGALQVFEGTCEGHIALQESEGVQGFGYDSIFVPDGLSVTLAEISIEEKNRLSHRGKAMRMLQCHLLKNHGSSSCI